MTEEQKILISKTVAARMLGGCCIYFNEHNYVIASEECLKKGKITYFTGPSHAVSKGDVGIDTNGAMWEVEFTYYGGFNLYVDLIKL